MNIKTIVAAFVLAFASSAFAADEPLPSYTLEKIEAAPSVSLPGVVQFRWGQVMGWCMSSPDCKEKMRVELQKHEGPWAGVADAMLQAIDDPKLVNAQQMTWTKDEGTGQVLAGTPATAFHDARHFEEVMEVRLFEGNTKVSRVMEKRLGNPKLRFCFREEVEAGAPKECAKFRTVGQPFEMVVFPAK